MINTPCTVKSKEHENWVSVYHYVHIFVSLTLLYNKSLLKYVICDSIYYINFEKTVKTNQTTVFRHTCLGGKI